VADAHPDVALDAGRREQEAGLPPSAKETLDVAIVGGGPVGAALALALGDSGLAVALLEARKELVGRDPRALALSQGTRLILERLAAWPGAQVTAIESIHVSQAGRFGRAMLRAEELGVPALGYTAEFGDLHRALATRLPDSGARLITGARVTAVRPAAGGGLVEYERDGAARALTARLIVQADGGKGLPGSGEVKDYGQSALICTVNTELPHGRRAYERFTPHGPMALLPLGDAYALVWTTPAEQVEARLALDDWAFLADLGAAFGNRQGRFLAAGPRAAFPLRLVSSGGPERPGLIRIGNAAQTLHPVAGQGFNLGLRDAWWLAETVLDSRREQLGDADFLARYRRRRRWDVNAGIAMTDLLVEGFAGAPPFLSQARGLALTALDLLPPFKQAFARKMMFGAQA
jgi:2-octaprenyl-6-methoxyphenol hydroxylase